LTTISSSIFFSYYRHHRYLHSFPTRRSSDLTASGIVGQPITYKGPDGKQYVAVLAGVGGWAGAIVSGDLDARDPTAALGFVNAIDRKSTRLNSSHVAISYAVFCLKKKKRRVA